VSAPWARRWHCATSEPGVHGHDHGLGTAKGRCQCGARLVTDIGLWGIFTAGADGRPAGDPVSTHQYRVTAVTHAAEDQLVDWVPADQIGPLPAARAILTVVPAASHPGPASPRTIGSPSPHDDRTRVIA
jgi:hypothetical protein